MKKASRGFISIEVIVAVAVVISAMSYLSYWLNEDADRKLNATAASNATVVLDATQKWMKDNLPAIDGAANPYVAYDTTAIQQYLPSGFVAKNIYGQSYSIRVNKVAPARLEVLVLTTGGEVISEKNLRNIAQDIGGQGGYISAQNINTAAGVGGGWSYPMASYGGSPGAGKLALALFFQDGLAVDTGDYLHRKVTPGRPEYNRMETAIDMNANNIDNAGAVTARSVTLPGGSVTNSLRIASTYFYGDTLNTAVVMPTGGSLYVEDYLGNPADLRAKNLIGQEHYATGWFRSQGDTGWYNEKWNGGWYMADGSYVRSYADKNVYTGGQMQAGTMYSMGRLRAGEYLQIDGWATDGSWCPWGGASILGQDGAGLPLYCGSDGLWHAMGGNSTIMGGPVAGGSDASIGVTLPSKKTVIITATAGQAGGSVTTQIVVDGAYCPTLADTSVVSGGNWSLNSIGYCQVTLGPGWHVFSTANSRYSGSGYVSNIQFLAL